MLASWACVVNGWEVVTPRNLNFDECWMVDWYLRWVDDRMMWGRLCAWMIESVTNVGWEAVTP